MANVSWHAPAHGWYCLNTDGAAKGIDGLTGCGGFVGSVAFR
jgi:hypothetical protein